MSPAVQSRLAAVAAPPIAEAQGWIAGRAFPADQPLIDVCQAVPGYPPPPDLVAFMAGALAAPSAHRYTEVPGLPALRAALATDIDGLYAGGAGALAADNVLISAGCNQAFCLALSALAQAGDEVILPLPYYFNYQMWLQMNGIGVRPVAFRPETGGVPDLAEIAAAIGPATRALVLISPNNPTGAVYPPAFLEAAFALCREAGIALVLDETYRDFMPDDGAPHGLFRRPDWAETLVHLYSFSKVFCLTGHRVGAVASAPDLLGQIGKAMDCVAICAPHLGQLAAAEGLRTLSDWRRGNAGLMRGRLAALRDAFDRPDVGYAIVSAGAYFAYLRHPHGGQTSHAVARRLADTQNLLALPGAMFGPGQDPYLRLAFANVDAALMPQIAARLAADAAAPF